MDGDDARRPVAARELDFLAEGGLALLDRARERTAGSEGEETTIVIRASV